jgi:hypothetical protein
MKIEDSQFENEKIELPHCHKITNKDMEVSNLFPVRNAKSK